MRQVFTFLWYVIWILEPRSPLRISSSWCHSEAAEVQREGELTESWFSTSKQANELTVIPKCVREIFWKHFWIRTQAVLEVTWFVVGVLAHCQRQKCSVNQTALMLLYETLTTRMITRNSSCICFLLFSHISTDLCEIGGSGTALEKSVMLSYVQVSQNVFVDCSFLVSVSMCTFVVHIVLYMSATARFTAPFLCLTLKRFVFCDIKKETWSLLFSLLLQVVKYLSKNVV